jgi:hypothetical protein
MKVLLTIAVAAVALHLTAKMLNAVAYYGPKR